MTSEKENADASIRCRGERCDRYAARSSVDRSRPRGDRHLHLARGRPASAEPRPSQWRSICSTRVPYARPSSGPSPTRSFTRRRRVNVGDLKHFDRTFQQTNRLRTEGTDNLLAAAREAEVRRFVAQSNANHRYAREGGGEERDDPLDATPVPTARQSSEAMQYLDQAVTDGGESPLRHGIFYGAVNDGLIEPVRKRQFPIVGDGGGTWSWIHLDDAAAATVLALEDDRRRHLQHRRRRAGGGARVAAGARRGPRRKAAPPLSSLGRGGVSRPSPGSRGRPGPATPPAPQAAAPPPGRPPPPGWRGSGPAPPPPSRRRTGPLASPPPVGRPLPSPPPRPRPRGARAPPPLPSCSVGPPAPPPPRPGPPGPAPPRPRGLPVVALGIDANSRKGRDD